MPMSILGRLPAILPRPYIFQCRRAHHVHLHRERGLRVLFCGADEFSIVCLRALNDARLNDTTFIDSIEVVSRRAKYTGRGLATIKEPPVTGFAKGLGLQTHARESFKNWNPPGPIDLVIAASFGLLIPYDILGPTTYGGINVHPSLLPDLNGAAPIERAILKGREYTGLSVQTLHPAHFDQGIVLAQTPAPGIPIGNKTGPELKAELAEIGAEMLMDMLKQGKYKQPHEKAGWWKNTKQLPKEEAPKITKQDTKIDWEGSSLPTWLLQQRALGGTWAILPNDDRLIIHEMVDTGKTDPMMRVPGIYIQEGHKYPLIRDREGAIAEIRESTYAGSRAREGNKDLSKVFKHESGHDVLLTDEEDVVEELEQQEERKKSRA